ncbi:hypothetical protein AB0M48_12790 [Lentzea sp. NPDC051208]
MYPSARFFSKEATKPAKTDQQREHDGVIADQQDYIDWDTGKI